MYDVEVKASEHETCTPKVLDSSSISLKNRIVLKYTLEGTNKAE